MLTLGTPQPDSEDPDLALAAALEAGDARRAMEIMVTAHGEPVYHYCRRMLGNTADGDDLSQTVFVQAFQSLNDLPRIRSVRGWLLRIARNRCVDRLRSLRRSARLLEENGGPPDGDPPRTDPLAEGDPRVAKALDDCLDRLDARGRAVLVLRFHDELSFSDMSELTSDSAGALRVRLVRALVALRKCLQRKGVRP